MIIKAPSIDVVLAAWRRQYPDRKYRGSTFIAGDTEDWISALPRTMAGVRQLRKAMPGWALLSCDHCGKYQIRAYEFTASALVCLKCVRQAFEEMA